MTERKLLDLVINYGLELRTAGYCEGCSEEESGLAYRTEADALLSEIRQRLEALERDAARYKRLRKGLCPMEIGEILGRSDDYDTNLDAEVDAAIDAAMAEGEG